ncbi:thiol reductant ABC exporter subunit CydC [Quadrisphaera sp. KR29]|uniref:thiol reductant ABC exporter subunit CydC n=1 Tax=Quadrisphaera sp. KR29 TaxID=3461391 RepID=UPI0040449812
MRWVLGAVPRGRAALAVAAGTGTVLVGAALLATSGALITAASLQPSSLFVLLPLITSVRLFGISRAALRYAERLVSHDLSLRLVVAVRARVLERLVPLAPAALAGARGGELLARVRADVDDLQDVFVRLVAPTAVAVLASSAAVALVAVVSAPLAVVLAVLLVLLGVALPAWARWRGRRPAVEAAAADAASGADLLDVVRGLADHLGGDGGRSALLALDAAGERQERAERDAARTAAAAAFWREAVPGLGLLAALVLVGTAVARGTTEPVLLAAAALGVVGSFEAVGGLGAAWAVSAGVQAAARRVEALAALTPAVSDPPAPRALPLRADLRLVGVGVRHPGAGRAVLEGFDLHVAEGEHVALVGPSGAGKSTVLALAARTVDPGAGRVLLGGADLRELALADVRAAVTWSPQQAQVLGGTLAGNLRIARPDADEALLEEVLHDVGLGDLVSAVGLHGWVGESGERLSAGERARVGLARALLAPSRVLLLDEPTAHLDRPLALEVVRRVHREPRSVLLVTHDPGVLGPGWTVRALADGHDGRRPTAHRAGVPA